MGIERSLMLVEDSGRYDLPLNKDAGTSFLILLIALMTFLSVMSLAASFALGGMAKRWSSGLENRLTIEILAETGNGIRPPAEIAQLENKISAVLTDNPLIESFKVMDKKDIQDLIAPWLGTDSMIDGMPLPGLVAIEMKDGKTESLDRLKKDITAIGQNIVIDTHESWLHDLLQLTGTLQFSALVLTSVIVLTTVAAVAGGVRLRMAVHRADVELLHLMGASDDYITRQFQRHTLILALKGGIIGVIAALLILLIIGTFSGGTGSFVVPMLSLSVVQVLALMMAPLVGCAIAALTARITVLRSLAQMP